ncbi:MAG: ferredoxin [Proteobacteria bacterium]|nr:ferredoxin [Pseudomonadota bacterium]
MNLEHLDLVTFHVTGSRPASGLDDVGKLTLKPALLAGYRDLTRLRYDYPLVLAAGETGEECLRSVSATIDDVLKQAAPGGLEGEALRKHTLRLEREIRSLVAQGAKATLRALWDRAAQDLASRTNEPVADNLSRARDALTVDGEVIDCDATAPAKLITHAWAADHRRKARAFLKDVNTLIVRLTDILRADYMKSSDARTADHLKASIGTSHADVFDFKALSRVLARTAVEGSLPETRRARINWALSVLKSQRFYPDPDCRPQGETRTEPLSFTFESGAAALAAFRERLPQMVELAKAISIAELEVENRYREAKHDPVFSHFDEGALGPKDLALFPSYLVCLRLRPGDGAQSASLVELLSTGLPVKVLVQIDDILEGATLAEGQFAFGVKSLRLATMAVGLNSVYVLQSSSSNLFQVRDRLIKGMAYPGPTLFSVYSGALLGAADTIPYLSAAAAMQSRAFPAFAYDPGAGPDWASRFAIDDNPQPDQDWPVQGFSYQDENRQRVAEDVAFTFVDFVACDGRHASHFARVPRARWNGAMIPVGEYLAHPPERVPERVPYLLMVDENDVLQRVIVDDRLILAARRCADMWHSLQELGGIHNSHARRLLEREKKRWDQEKERELAALRARPQPAPAARTPEAVPPAPAPAAEARAPEGAAPAPKPAAPAAAEAAEEKPSDDPYVETPRCTTCNECTQINPKMFAYNENKQAYIADPGAGTYRELVEAAESCQVSIIHPGKPRNQNEPGLEELIKRAEPFL